MLIPVSEQNTRKVHYFWQTGLLTSYWQRPFAVQCSKEIRTVGQNYANCHLHVCIWMLPHVCDCRSAGRCSEKHLMQHWQPLHVCQWITLQAQPKPVNLLLHNASTCGCCISLCSQPLKQVTLTADWNTVRTLALLVWVVNLELKTSWQTKQHFLQSAYATAGCCLAQTSLEPVPCSMKSTPWQVNFSCNCYTTEHCHLQSCRHPFLNHH